MPEQLVIEQVPPAVNLVAPTEGEPAPKPTAESETASPPDGEEKKSATPDPEAEKRREQRSFQKRIDRLHKRAAEAEAREKVAQERAARVEAAQQPQVDPGAPRLEQFDYDPEKYAAAKAEYAEKKTREKLATEQRANVEKESHNRLVSSWEDKASVAEAKYDDFHEVVGELQPTNAVSAAVMDAENAGDVAYYLGKHPKEAQRIAALPPLSAVREIGKLEAKLLAEAPKPKQPSKAPAPIDPLKGTGQVASATIGPEEDFEVFLKKRRAQQKRK